MWDPKITGEKERWAFLWKVSPSPNAYILADKSIQYLTWLERTGKTRLNRVTGQTLKSGIPKVTAGGNLNVMNYQINLDGAGPFKWSFGAKDICIVRCENNADNGPFGGCIPVQQIRPVKKPAKQGGRVEYGHGYRPDPKKENAKKPAPRPKAGHKKPTKEEIKAAMGGESYDKNVAYGLENESINDDDKGNLQAAYKNKHPINNYSYKRRVKARRG
ncbi:hypothetical protein TWF703_000019 [Orbilia oligospora]|uniref:Uncharacterized protein n=1 Tax=Orbilia oligospora TaxID=2813651 RepID=A0A7C8PCJ2_ORBOL|nr:hypothetical protein TWF703_000019 [Orbilia oligospora]